MEFIEAARRLGLSVVEKKELTNRGVRAFQISSALLYLLLQHFDTFIVKAHTDVQKCFSEGGMDG